ncbi:hypothetical protein P261_02257 [Lachnospiraceae bacterium TWA4]|nr:hypothetical protein P261_02257 [Lachnospiraceae bacterium TWA4]
MENLETIPSDDPTNPLILGTAIHKAMETDLKTAIKEYYASYNIITTEHENEVIKMEYWIPKLKSLIPEGLHEVNFKNDVYEGTADLLVPVKPIERMENVFDLYDFKYSNNIEHYMDSRQLHVYKYFLERIKGIYIKRMYFVFVPKVRIRQKGTESIEQFRTRLYQELSQKEIKIKEVLFDESKVFDFYESTMRIGLTKSFDKMISYYCDWCEYKDYCRKDLDYMLLPKAERRDVRKTQKRKLWIYGGCI